MEYVKSTAKQKKLAERSEPKILVAFGKTSLEDLLKLRDTHQESDVIYAPIKSPAVWRRISICTIEEIKNFQEYTNWAAAKFGINKEKK